MMDFFNTPVPSFDLESVGNLSHSSGSPPFQPTQHPDVFSDLLMAPDGQPMMDEVPSIGDLPAPAEMGHFPFMMTKTVPPPAVELPTSPITAGSVSSFEDLSRAEEKVAPPPTKKRRRKRKRKVVPPEVLAERRRRHNEVEIKRRKRIAANYDEIRQLTGCEGTSKGDILSAAINCILRLSNKLDDTGVKAETVRKSRSYEVASCQLNTNGDFVDCNDNFAILMGKRCQSVRQNPHQPGCEMVACFSSLVCDMIEHKSTTAECIFKQWKEGSLVSVRCTVYKTGGGMVSGVALPMDKHHYSRPESDDMRL